MPGVRSPTTSPRFSIWTRRARVSAEESDLLSTNTTSFAAEMTGSVGLGNNRLFRVSPNFVANLHIVFEDLAHQILNIPYAHATVSTQIEDQRLVVACLPTQAIPV